MANIGDGLPGEGRLPQTTASAGNTPVEKEARESPVGKVVAVFGLGNPGSQYQGTRHNIGFLVVDLLVRRHGFRSEKGFRNIELYRGRIGDFDVYLGKPLTYMNLSGQAARPVLQMRKIPLASTLVVADDFALPMGRLRLRADGSAGGHNGLKSLIADLGSQTFPRLRVGIGPVPERWDPADFVLGRFTKVELEQLDGVVERTADGVECWLGHGIEAAMNQVNRVRLPSMGENSTN